jgi:hypothetical protein
MKSQNKFFDGMASPEMPTEGSLVNSEKRRTHYLSYVHLRA